MFRVRGLEQVSNAVHFIKNKFARILLMSFIISLIMCLFLHVILKDTLSLVFFKGYNGIAPI